MQEGVLLGCARDDEVFQAKLDSQVKCGEVEDEAACGGKEEIVRQTK